MTTSVDTIIDQYVSIFPQEEEHLRPLLDRLHENPASITDQAEKAENLS